jgi:hypothetical protein
VRLVSGVTVNEIEQATTEDVVEMQYMVHKIPCMYFNVFSEVSEQSFGNHGGDWEHVTVLNTQLHSPCNWVSCPQLTSPFTEVMSVHGVGMHVDMCSML